jgi:membrane associated rhomboid family serine protease
MDPLTFGGRLPWAIGLSLVLTVGLSVLGAVGHRHGTTVFELGALRPADVLQGQLWRLVTWPFLEPGPFGLIFTCVFLWWLGKDLAEEMGSRNFVIRFGTIMALAALGTTAFALVDPGVRTSSYLGGFAWTSALAVAWGFWFPHRVVRLYFVIQVRGYWFAWFTIAFTLIFAAYAGWEAYLPELFAEGLVVGWMYQASIKARLAKAGRAFGTDRRWHSSARESRAKRAKSVAYLHVVEAHDDDPPDLPPDFASSVDRALGLRKDRSE